MPLTLTVETLGCGALHEGMMADATLEAPPDPAMPRRNTSRFPRTARLLRHADFERVYKLGRRHFSASMTVFFWPRPEAETEPSTRAGASSAIAEGRSAARGLRVGFTVSRALGGAVQRNRMKRRLREAVRLSLPPLGIAADVVINPKKSLLAADFADVRNEVARAFVVIEQKVLQMPATKVPAEPPIKRNRKPEAGKRS